MRSLAYIVLLVLAVVVAAAPITPAAPEYQRRAEQMRSEGMAEHDIAKQLSLPIDEHKEQPRPVLTQLSSKLHSLFNSDQEIGARDLSGDIAPGSLEAPEMLPRAAAPESLGDIIRTLLQGEDSRRGEFGYEGKELELRRPTGMRHWGSPDPWKL